MACQDDRTNALLPLAAIQGYLHHPEWLAQPTDQYLAEPLPWLSLFDARQGDLRPV